MKKVSPQKRLKELEIQLIERVAIVFNAFLSASEASWGANNLLENIKHAEKEIKAAKRSSKGRKNAKVQAARRSNRKAKRKIQKKN